ncbi:hypothetical protein CUMW_265110, partial [Citrus unshiu]
LVGVESIVEEIESLLAVESKDVYCLGIWGIGGIGKTTIARAIFDKISSDFEGSCFLENVIEESQDREGTDKVEGICLNMSKVKEIHLNANTFTKMRKLRF